MIKYPLGNLEIRTADLLGRGRVWISLFAAVVMEQQCGVVKNLLKEILAVKRSGAESAELKPLLTKAALEVVKLRLTARQQVEKVEEHKAQTAESKAEVDQSNLQLQNLLYEKNYYTKELASCRSFE